VELPAGGPQSIAPCSRRSIGPPSTFLGRGATKPPSSSTDTPAWCTRRSR